MKYLFIITGWLGILSLPLTVNGYLKNGVMYTKWGAVTGDSARGTLIGHSLLVLLFGGYAIRETLIFIKKKIDKKPKQ